MPGGELWVERLGLVGYGEALAYQRDVARGRIAGSIPEDLLLLVEHPPVVTLGRSSKERNLLASPALLAERGVELFEELRGRTSGFAIPLYVLDTPHGKVPLARSKVRGRDGEFVIVEAWDGALWRERNPM